MDADVEVALHVRAAHTEGPVRDAVQQALWWVDTVGERVHRFRPEHARTEAVVTGPAIARCADPGGGSPPARHPYVPKELR